MKFDQMRLFEENFQFLVRAFRRKTQTIVVTFHFFLFFWTNEVTDFISFIGWLPLTATLM